MNDPQPHATVLTLKAPGVRSLAWRGEALIDWVGGGDVYRLDGSSTSASVRYAYSFDAVVDCEPYTVIYRRFGTKGLLLKDGEVLRELNRSFYQAEVYHYPVALGRTATGKVLLAHCPEDYNQLELEDAETGARLTIGPREPDDFFHSDLAFSPGGRRLLSAGWIWHPWCGVRTVEIGLALETPSLLDGMALAGGKLEVDLGEVTSAAFVDDHQLLLGVEGYELPATAEAEASSATGMMRFDCRTETVLATRDLGFPPGTMMPLGSERVVTFFQHPRLLCLRTGAILAEWPELPTGTRASCISVPQLAPPVLALDPARGRFAVAHDEAIHVVTLTGAGLRSS